MVAQYERMLWQSVLVAIVYFIAAWFGLSLAFVNSNVSAVWPPTGIALAVLIVFGRGLWPGVLIGAFAANALATGNPYTSMAIAIGNTLEAVVGESLLRTRIGDGHPFTSVDHVFAYTLVELFVATPIAAIIGVTTLLVGGLAEFSSAPLAFVTWWLGDAAGAFVVGIPLILWSYRATAVPERVNESILVFMTTIITGLVLFTNSSIIGAKSYPASYMAIPVLIWSAFRLEQAVAQGVVLLLQTFALIGTLAGHGPFAVVSPDQSLLFLQVFMGVCSVGVLAASTSVQQFRQMNANLDRLVDLRTAHLVATRARLESIFEIADDALIVIDQAGTIELFNQGAVRIFGYSATQMVGQSIDLLLPDRFVEAHHRHLAAFARSLDVARRMGERQDIFGKRSDGSEFPAEASISKFTSEDGELIFSVILRDITVRKQIELTLRSSLHEKEVLLQEVHHRVKNNLQIVTSLLRLQAAVVENPQFVALIKDSQHRIAAMAMVHERLYQSADISRLNCRLYVHDLVVSVLRSYHDDQNKHIALDVFADPSLTMEIDMAIPIGLIVTELVSNSCKHAFPERSAGKVAIRLTYADGEFGLVVEDDGVGIPDDVDVGASLGMQLVIDLTNQLHGTMAIDRSRGSSFQFVFPYTIA